jgi:1-deoxy-D-xylulose-5-phosphate reductoisomerase
VDVKKVYLTASGGALLDYRRKELKKVTVKEVLSHPTWQMGPRITVDSATLVNKGFEVIEAHRFFNLPIDEIDIIIHKESTIHALIESKDNVLFACLYLPDMRIPISFALNYPQRVPVAHKSIFSFSEVSSKRGHRGGFSLTFLPLKLNNFPLLKIILEAGKRKDNSLIIMNACDEVAIDYFLAKKIGFPQIYKVMEYMFTHYTAKKIHRVEDIFFWDSWARERTKMFLDKLC